MNFSSLLSYVQEASQTFGDHPALTIRRRVKKETIIYCELPMLLSQLEAFFTKEQITPHTKILTWGTNSPEYALILLGCFSFNRTAVPIDYRNSQATIEAIVAKTKPTVAFVSRFLRHDFLTKLGIRVYYIEDLLMILKNISKAKKFSQLLTNKKYISPHNLSEIVFTSGTTGMPKGVVIRQRHILSNLKHVEPSLPDLSHARIVSILPLSHMFEQLVGLLLAFGQGASIYYPTRITSVRLLEAFQEHKPTHQIFVPQLLSIIWNRIEANAGKTIGSAKFKRLLTIARLIPMGTRRLLFHKIHTLFGGNLKMIAVGGAPMDVEIAKNFEAVGFPVLEGYGATEVTAVATFNRPGKVRLGTVGTPIEGVKISTDENGEIYIKSDATADGYFQDTKRTQKSYTSAGYRTGDIGYIDSHGYLTIRGRDDFKLVLPSGEKVFVEDLERIIKKDNRVKDVCVVAKRVSGGDAIHAYFILKKGVSDKLSTVVASINSHLESKQQIASFSTYKGDDFPRTHTLKIDRKHLVVLAAKALTSRPGLELGASETTQDIFDVVAKVAGVPRDSLQYSDLLTTDLGLDSLSRVELVSLAEEYLGIILDEAKINQKTTVADLAKMVLHAQVVDDVFIPTWQYTKVGELLRWILLKCIFLPLHAYIVRIHYPQQSIPPIPGGSLIIFNHPGPGDGITIVRTLSHKVYKFMVDMTASLWKKRTFKTKLLEVAASGIPLYESGQPLMRVLRLNSDLLQRGYNLLFAPQGTMQRSEREDPFKPGLGFLVKELDCPVTIVRIRGYRDFWPPPKEEIAQAKLTNLLPKRRGTVTLTISSSIKRDWSAMTPVQITNFLEEKYQEL